MNRNCLMACLILTFAPRVAHAEDPVQYQIDAKFIACPTNDVAELLPAQSFAITIMDKLEGSKFDPEALPASWSILSTPTIISKAGQEAVIRVSQKPIQFFTKRSDGSFQLQQLDAEREPGLGLTVTVSEYTNGIVKLQTKVELRSIRKRLEIPGVTLDVGTPIVNSRTQQFNTMLKLGAWVVSSLPGDVPSDPSNSDRAVLILIRVHRLSSKGQLLAE